MKRIIFTSKEMGVEVKKSSNKKIEIFSFFPIDRADCECQKLILEWKKKLALTPPDKRPELIAKEGYLICPHSKKGMKHREITCRKCGEVVGYCWSTDETLKDWCDFHYVQWTKGYQWKGCFTPHISPITQELCIECCCGADTRDFTINRTLSSKMARKIEKENKIGRKFGTSESKFLTRVVKDTMIPFNKEKK